MVSVSSTTAPGVRNALDRLQGLVRRLDVAHDVVGVAQHGLLVVAERGSLDGGVAQGGDLLLGDAGLAGDALVLEDLVGGAAQAADAQDRELAQLGIELAAIEQRVAHADEALQPGLGVRQHAIDVEVRLQLVEKLGVLAGGVFDFVVRNARHRTPLRREPVRSLHAVPAD